MGNPNHFPYDRLNVWPVGDDLDTADRIVSDDRHLQAVVDPPEAW